MTDRDRLATLLPAILAAIDDAGSVPDDWTGSEYVDSLADRLLAAGVTLASPVKAEPPDLAALRGALGPSKCPVCFHTIDFCAIDTCGCEVAVALATTAPPPAKPDAERLDVERLERALVAWKRKDQPDKPVDVIRRWASWFLAPIVVEYARLAQPPTATEPGEPDHPKDSYSYSGCDCERCQTIRAAATPRLGDAL